MRVYIDTEYSNLTIWHYPRGGPITDRNIREYEILLPDDSLDISTKLQYTEIGAGLAEFIPFLVSNYNMKHKPTIIDYVNYSSIIKILNRAQKLNLNTILEQKIEQLLQRAQIITNDKVILINKKLEQAINEQPNLKNSADVLIDCYGAIVWEPDKKEADSLEKKILKPDGKLYRSIDEN